MENPLRRERSPSHHKEDRKRESVKNKCQSCDWAGNENETLVANPFDPRYDLVGCPECFEVNTMELVCDEPGCIEIKSCGFPTPDGYRMTCGKHYRERGEA